MKCLDTKVPIFPLLTEYNVKIKIEINFNMEFQYIKTSIARKRPKGNCSVKSD